MYIINHWLLFNKVFICLPRDYITIDILWLAMDA